MLSSRLHLSQPGSQLSPPSTHSRPHPRSPLFRHLPRKGKPSFLETCMRTLALLHLRLTPQVRLLRHGPRSLLKRPGVRLCERFKKQRPRRRLSARLLLLQLAAKLSRKSFRLRHSRPSFSPACRPALRGLVALPLLQLHLLLLVEPQCGQSLLLARPPFSRPQLRRRHFRRSKKKRRLVRTVQPLKLLRQSVALLLLLPQSAQLESVMPISLANRPQSFLLQPWLPVQALGLPLVQAAR